MDVRMPDGTIITGVPDDINQAELLRRYSLFKPPEAPTEDTGFFDMAGRAVVRGAKQTGSLLADVLPAMAAKAVGADEYAAKQMAEAAATQKEIEQKYGARYKELADVKGLGDVLPFIAETVLEQVPNLATALVPGVGGGAIAARTAAGLAAKEAAKRVATGQAAGAFLGSYALNAPEIFQNIYEETGQMETGASVLAGSVAAALDSILPAQLLSKFTPGMKAGVVEKILEKSGMPPGIARGAAAGVITGAATEAPTEAAQEAISIAAEKFVQENAPAWGSKEFNRLIEAGVRGGVGGGGISGVAGAVKGIGERRLAEAAFPGKPGRSALDQIDQEEVETEEEQLPEFKKQEPLFTPDELADVQAKTTKVEEPLEETPAAKPEDLATLKELRTQITQTRGEIRNLEEAGTDEATMADWYTELERLQAQERALRRGEEVETLQAAPILGPPELGVKRTYELTDAEKAVTEEDLKTAGFLPNEIKRIMFNAKPKSASPLAKDVLSRVAAGQIRFGTELRAVTPEDIQSAETDQERARLQAAYDKGSQLTLLPAQQMGLDLAPAEEGVSREFVSPISASEEEFKLTAPEGTVPAEVGIETEEAPAAAPLNLVKKDTERLKEMLGNLQPSVEAEQGVKNYKAAIDNFLDEVREYLDEPNVQKRKDNIGFINEFFNRFGLTSDTKLAQNLVTDLKGKTSAQQAQILAERTRMPNITTPAGLSELRNKFQDFMEQQSAAKVGEFPGKAATKTFASDARIPAQVANIIRQLRNKPTRLMSPDEKAFMAYMSKWTYGLAMKSAAYDIANDIPMGTMFSEQGAKSAALFQKFVEENFPAQIYEAFNQTIQEYQNEKGRAAYAAKLIQVRQQNRKEYMKQLAQERAEVEEEMRKVAKKEAERTKAESLIIQKAAFNRPEASFKPMHPAIEQRIEEEDVDGALAIIEQLPGAKYWQLLARRLRAANITATIRFDEQERLIRFSLAKIADTVETFVGNMQAAYPDVYEKHLAPAINEAGEIDIRGFAKGLKAIKDGALIGKDTVDSAQVNWMTEKYTDAVKSLDAPGFYMFGRTIDTINLNREQGGNSYYAFFHELIHASTAAAIRNPDKLNPAQKEALDNLNNLYAYTVEQYPAVSEYGFQNLDEFIAEAFSNADFQRLLSRLPYKNTESSLWSRFIDYVRKLLGGKDTVLFGTLANADVLMTAAEARAPGANKYTGTLMGNAPKVKRTTDGSFRTSPDMDLNRRWIDVLKNRSDWNQVKGGVGRLLENVNDATRKYFLGAFTLRQLQDLIGGRLGDSAQNFINAVEDMLEDRNAILDKVSKIEKKWGKYQSDNPQKGKDLSLLMIDTTLAGIDPDRQTGKDLELDRRWKALGPEGQAIYREVRDFYKERLNEYQSTFARNIELSMIAKGKTPAEIKAVRTELFKKFAEDSIEPYFPLKRFGRYWLQIGTEKGETREFYMFDSADARNAFRDQMLADMKRNGDTRGIDAGQNLKDFVSKNIRDLRTLEDIEKIIDNAGKDDPAMSNTKLKEVLKDNIEQLYYLTLPNKSVRKMFINRKQVSGASEDMLRAFVDSSFHMAYQQSRFKYARRMFDQLDAAEKLRKSKPVEMLKEKTVDEDYIAELNRRLEYVMNPTDTGTIPSVLSNISFLWYLTAPASAFVNMMGVPAIGFPVLAARFGKVKAAAMLLSYGKKFMTAGFKDADGNFAMPSLGTTDLNPREKAAYDLFVSSGLIDITQSHDLAGVAEAPSNLYTGRTNTIMKGFSAMFHHAERFNREVVAMSAFRMAYDAAISAGQPPHIAFNKAVDQAKDLTYRSMFDYSTLNKPRYLQNAYAKVILQFKQFPQQMTYLLGRSGYEWLSNLTPDQIATIRENIQRERIRYGQEALSAEELTAAVDEQVKLIRKEGRDRLLGTLGMTFLFAGATGMPLFSVGASVIEALHAAFSDDDEPPLDFENWFKNWMATTFGNFWGDSMSRGVITQATGMNFADRMSLNDLWFRDARKSQDEVTAFQNMIINLLGPTAALGVSGAEALKLFNDGYYYRGAEKIMPAILKQPMVGARYATEGVLTLKGDELISQEELSAKDALSQSLGFAPEKVTQRQKANIEKKTAEQDIENKRQDLLNAFFMSIDTGDDGLKERVIDKIARFNRMYSNYPITADTLTRSVKMRYKARALAEITGGIPINKNLMSTLEEMGYYGQ